MSASIPLVGELKVHKFEFQNGLKLLIVPDRTSPTFAYQTWFRVGSRNEVPGYTGLAHLFEHMMFKGTKNFQDGEFDRILEQAGVEGENAFTSRDYTAYVQELPRDKLDLIAKLESDRMVNLLVNEPVFKTETEVVQNERKLRTENSPDGMIYQEIFASAFTKHPYRWPVIGYKEDLDRMNSKDAELFYRSYYNPNHATIVVTGDVDVDDVAETVNKYYSQIPAQASPAHKIAEEPEQNKIRSKKLKLNIQVEKLVIGYHIPNLLHVDLPILDILQTILAGGKSSRLHKALVETGIASSVGAYGFESKDPSLLLIMVNLQKGKRAAAAEKIILKELETLSTTGPSAQELETAKNRISFDFYENLNSNSDRAKFLGHYETLTGDFQNGIKTFKLTQDVNAEQVTSVTKRYLQPTKRTRLVGVPK